MPSFCLYMSSISLNLFSDSLYIYSSSIYIYLFFSAIFPSSSYLSLSNFLSTFPPTLPSIYISSSLPSTTTFISCIPVLPSLPLSSFSSSPIHSTFRIGVHAFDLSYLTLPPRHTHAPPALCILRYTTDVRAFFTCSNNRSMYVQTGIKILRFFFLLVPS